MVCFGLIGLSLGTWGCAGNGPRPMPVPPTDPEPEVAAEDVYGKMSTGQILEVLAVVNEGQMVLAELALERSSHPVVRQTAQRILDEHRTLQNKVDKIAEAVDADLAETGLSSFLSSRMKNAEEGLDQLSGADFNRAFFEYQIELHRLVLQSTREDLVPSADKPQVAQLLDDATNRLEHQLATARQRFQETQKEAVGGGPEAAE